MTNKKQVLTLTRLLFTALISSTTMQNIYPANPYSSTTGDPVAQGFSAVLLAGAAYFGHDFYKSIEGNKRDFQKFMTEVNALTPQDLRKELGDIHRNHANHVTAWKRNKEERASNHREARSDAQQEREHDRADQRVAAAVNVAQEMLKPAEERRSYLSLWPSTPASVQKELPSQPFNFEPYFRQGYYALCTQSKRKQLETTLVQGYINEAEGDKISYLDVDDFARGSHNDVVRRFVITDDKKPKIGHAYNSWAGHWKKGDNIQSVPRSFVLLPYPPIIEREEERKD
jgi:hypothetical protein